MLAHVRIGRPDHWFKNVFVLPGIVVAVYANDSLLRLALIPQILLALGAVCLIASSYYTLNELLDARYDALHPIKRHRPVPSGLVNVRAAYGQWLGLGLLGMVMGAATNPRVFLVVVVLWLLGCAYNIPPIRTKDKPFLDVLSESVNNPMRLLVGWYCTGTLVLPPTSLVVAYWMVGAFFMAVKRLGEYRRIDDAALAAAYRKSFAYYNEERLLTSIVYYAVAFGLFFGIFLVRYRLELILAVPAIAGFIAYYIHLGFLPDSPTQSPENLFRRPGFALYTLGCAVLMATLLFISVPQIGQIFAPSFAQGSP
jgi:decaprenyl-phosphate phosphoribosyltransferase